jgi:hypothetical protein
MAETIPSSEEKNLEIEAQRDQNLDHVYNDLHDAEIEKRVLRKLDWNLISLVMALCESSSIISVDRVLTNSSQTCWPFWTEEI